MTPDGNDLLCPIGSLSALAEIVRQTAHNSDSDAPCGLVSDAFEHCENASSTDVETQSDTCRTGNASGSGTAEKYGALSQAITDQIVQSLDSANEITERAVLAIGNQISSLFEIAKNNNEAAVSSLGEVLGRSASHSHDELIGADEATSIASLLENQRRSIQLFVQKTEEFFRRQTVLAEESQSRVRNMECSISKIQDIVVGSKILAINAQIEAARLGQAGQAFSVVAQQMKVFSMETKNANDSIDASVDSVAEMMSRFRHDTIEMQDSLSEFSHDLASEVAELEDRTRLLMDSLSGTLDQISSSNEQLTSRSQLALSELQFQDPLAQDLRRTLHKVKKLQSIIDTGTCDEREPESYIDHIGGDGTLERDAGEVELF